MASVVVSSKGQVVIPSAVRRRLGLGAGARLTLVEEPGGLRLVVERSVAPVELDAVVGMLRAPSRGRPRSLADFDPASMLREKKR